MNDSVFTKIIKGELPAHFVYRDDRCVAFLPQEAVAPEHILVVPVAQVDHLWDMKDDDFNYLMQVTKRLGGLLRDNLDYERIIEVVEGFEVPHVHVHLIPANTGLEHMVSSPKLMLTDSEKEKIAQKLSQIISIN